jgi:hypothetical protein
LTFKVAYSFKVPIGVVAISVRVLPYGDSVCGAESYTSQTVDTVFFFAAYGVGFSVIAVSIVGALVNANFAADATFLIAFNDVFRDNVSFHLSVSTIIF